MKQSIILILIAGFLTLGLTNYQSTRAQLVGPPAPLKIAVVNVNRVLTECRENQDRINLLQQKELEIEKQLATLRKQADGIKAEIDAKVFKPGTSESHDLYLKWVNTNIRIETLGQAESQYFDIQTHGWMENLYRKFLAEVNRLALQQNISLVLNHNQSPIPSPSLTALQNMIRNHNVLYHHKNLIDLTDQVLQNLNTNYDKIKH